LILLNETAGVTARLNNGEIKDLTQLITDGITVTQNNTTAL